MTGLCGWLSPDSDTPQAKSILQNMAEMLGVGETPNTSSQTASYSNAHAASNQSVALEKGIIAVSVGKPIWVDRDSALLAQQRGNSHALIDAYISQDVTLLDRLRGSFAFVIIDSSANRIVAAIDRLGQHQLYYSQIPNGLVFGTTANSVRAHPQVITQLSHQGIFNYM